MIALLQRVSAARVEVEGVTAGSIGAGLLAFIGVQRNDDPGRAERLLDRMLGYRLFDDDQGKMNRSLREHGGGLLLVPQFTLAADTDQGSRASFTPAAEPALARQLYDHLVRCAQASHAPVASGVFGAMMQVHLTNSGPVTFWLQVPPGPRKVPAG